MEVEVEEMEMAKIEDVRASSCQADRKMILIPTCFFMQRSKFDGQTNSILFIEGGSLGQPDKFATFIDIRLSVLNPLSTSPRSDLATCRLILLNPVSRQFNDTWKASRVESR